MLLLLLLLDCLGHDSVSQGNGPVLALLTGLGAGPLLLQLLLLAGQGGVPLVVVLLVPRHGLVHLGLVGLLVRLADLLPGL